ncbi:hypothetical protein NEF87_004573 [Candidatus Lokiarchaeum ossiferum]|uniref:DUF4328 domain-containing protein n=1 Tax=Candidatus Lokiarchaeum ossiferum TaxID=2951803 RepID=A0ABY6HY27_9ARCH|nr:hypothetical protein NEF87_004573 [Candidatus Lokiarchaeum sp. B-35]
MNKSTNLELIELKGPSFLQKFFEKISLRSLWIISGFGFLSTIIIYLIMAPIELELKEISPFGVMELEFMWTRSQAQVIIDAWGLEYIQKELFVTYLDFVFMPAYAILFSSFSLAISKKIVHNKTNLKKSPIVKFFSRNGLVIGLFPWIAVIFDIIENLNIIYILTNPEMFRNFAPFLTSVCASIKFSFLLLSILFSLVEILVFLFMKNKRMKEI